MRCKIAITNWLWVLGLILVVGAVTPLRAEPVAGGNGGGSSASTSYENTGSEFNVTDPGSGNGHQGVFYDPDAGPWLKTLSPAGGNFGVGIYKLVEQLQVMLGPLGAQGSAWTDYHEEIKTAGWTWVAAGPLGEPWGHVNDAGSGMTYVVPPGNTVVNWTFAPALPVGTQLTLTKWMSFAGVGGGGNPVVPLVIAQWPTVPEPGTCVLLVTGLIGLLAYAWRRRS